jgi:hypothetical protein
MAGLVAACWREDREEQAQRRFARARAAFVRIKELACNTELESPGFKVARFASPGSTCPDVVVGRAAVAAAAGWWYDDARDEAATLRALADGTAAPELFDRLQGQYLVLSFDLRTRTTRAAGDRLGLFPIYVADDDGVAWISTSAAALAAALKRALDRQALAALFMGDAIRSPRSAFVGIRRLAMGEEATLRDGRLTVARTWVPFFAPRRVRSLDDAVDEGVAILQRTCAEIRRRWPRWVADLTSGLDSRLVLAAMAAPGDVHTTVNGPEQHLDVRISRQISQSLGWTLHGHHVPADWGARRWQFFRRGVGLAEGELDGAALDRTIDAKLSLAPHFDAALSGGGGELLRDFFWQQEFVWRGRTTRLDVARLLRYRFFFAPARDVGLFDERWQRAYVDEQARQVAGIVALAPEALNTAKLDAIYVWKSSGHIGRYQGAAFPLIASPMPLATSALLAYASSLPWRLRVHSLLARALITRLHPRLAAMPTCYGGSARPLSLARAGDLARYGGGAARKLVRKLGQVTLGRSLLGDTTSRPDDPRWERDFVRVLECEGFLDAGNLRTRDLYRSDGLERLLGEVRRGELGNVRALHALVSAEWLARIVA